MRSVRLSAPWRPPGRLNVTVGVRTSSPRRRRCPASSGSSCPTWRDVLGETSQVAALDAADARRRLHRAVIRLLSDTASYRPVVLAIDDLQWADRDTLLLLSELLTVSLRNVLVLGAHRAGEFEPGSAGLTSASLRSIELSPLAREDVEELLATVSGRVVELGDVAAEFHQRTQGNPLQVRQLLYRAQREGALIPVGPAGSPSWDLRVLASIEVTATAAEFLRPLPRPAAPDDRAVLSSLSCIGGEFDLDDATAAAAQPPDVVAQALWACLELRLLEALDSGGRRIANAISRDARYRFSHDRVAEARARTACPTTPYAQTHLRIGRWLVAAGGRPVVRGRAPRRHRRTGARRRRRAHSVRRGVPACGAKGAGAGLVPVGARVLPQRFGPAR